MLKNTLKCVLLAAALTGSAATAAFADDGNDDGLIPGTITGNIAFTTDYRFRGTTQTQGDPALQGGITWTHPTGFYLGAWGSNVNFVDGDDAHIEIDGFVGLTNTIDAFTYDVGAIYYAYPGSDADAVGLGNYNYWEIYGSLGYDFGVAALKGSLYYSPDFYGEIGDAIYYKAAGSVPLPFLPYGAKIDAWGGYQTFLDFSGGDYWDWSVGLGFTVKGIGLDFRYTDTNLKAGNAYWLGPYTGDGSGSRFVFTISKSF